ncbi:acetoacetate decarboxylase family protein [Williamsia sp. Leaf354]|uniref:acetoacetate decarboxylase family protein n=1 Tax=Williamsia sp. Leaf354 TaxID=1736349 RepID=UPI0006F1C683|nr:acetoacetate decarboxylase family protein [Williamsia sp. Leaf354]
MVANPIASSESRWRGLASTIPEGVATPAMNDALPDVGSPAPWSIAGRGVFWSAKARRSDRDLLPPALARFAVPLLRVGFGVRYSHTPVGTYNELGGVIVYARPGGVFGHIPFLPVDSAATMRGGRENWALPKVLAEFSGDPAERSEFTASGDGWSVGVSVGDAAPARALAVPKALGWPILSSVIVPVISGMEQVFADGSRARTGALDIPDFDITTAETTVTVSTTGSEPLRRLFPDRAYRGNVITYRDVVLGAPRIR